MNEPKLKPFVEPTARSEDELEGLAKRLMAIPHPVERQDVRSALEGEHLLYGDIAGLLQRLRELDDGAVQIPLVRELDAQGRLPWADGIVAYHPDWADDGELIAALDSDEQSHAAVAAWFLIDRGLVEEAAPSVVAVFSEDPGAGGEPFSVLATTDAALLLLEAGSVARARQLVRAVAEWSRRAGDGVALDHATMERWRLVRGLVDVVVEADISPGATRGIARAVRLGDPNEATSWLIARPDYQRIIAIHAPALAAFLLPRAPDSAILTRLRRVPPHRWLLVIVLVVLTIGLVRDW